MKKSEQREESFWEIGRQQMERGAQEREAMKVQDTHKQTPRALETAREPKGTPPGGKARGAEQESSFSKKLFGDQPLDAQDAKAPASAELADERLGADRSELGGPERDISARDETNLQQDAASFERKWEGAQEFGRATDRKEVVFKEQGRAERREETRAERLDATREAAIEANTLHQPPSSPTRLESRDTPRLDDARLELDATSNANASASAEQVTGTSTADEVARAEELQQLADKLIDACHTGIDQQGRQVMMLDVQVPGRGSVRVRLRKQGDGVEVRMRADNPELGALLKARSGSLRDQLSSRSISISTLEVAS
jgi:hypothetical protein